MFEKKQRRLDTEQGTENTANLYMNKGTQFLRDRCYRARGKV